MNSKIQRFRDTSRKPGPFDQKYVPINIGTDKVTGAVTLTIEGTGTTIVGTNLLEAGRRLILAYGSDEEKSSVIATTLEHCYGF